MIWVPRVAWALKIVGVLYVVLSVPFLIQALMAVPSNVHWLQAYLIAPTSFVSSLLHGLGALGLGILLETLAQLHDRLERDK